MSEDIKKKKDSNIPAGLGAFVGGSIGAIPLRGAQDIALGSLVDDFAKDMGSKAVDNPSKIMKRVGAGKIAIPAIAGALIANKIYKGKGDKDMEDKQAYLSSQDLEKLAQENPELAEEVSLELLNKIAGFFVNPDKNENAKEVRKALNETDLSEADERMIYNLLEKNPMLGDYAEREISEAISGNENLEAVQRGENKYMDSVVRGGIGGGLGGLTLGTILATALANKKNPSAGVAGALTTAGGIGGGLGGLIGGVKAGDARGKKHLQDLNPDDARELSRIEVEKYKDLIRGSFQGGYMKGDPKPIQQEAGISSQASLIDKDVLEKIASKDMDLAEEISRMILEKEASNLPMKIVDETKGLSEADKKKIAKIIAAAGGTAMAAGIGAKATKAVKNKKKKDDEEKAASVIDKDILEKIAKEDKELAEEISRMILEKSAKEKIEPKEIDKEPKKDNPGEKLVEKEQKKMKPEKAAEETDEKQEKKASELTQEDLKKIKEILSK
jgi:hypothetical protein